MDLYYIQVREYTPVVVSRFGLAVRREAGKQRDLGSNLLRISFIFKVVVSGHCLVTLSLTINKTLKCLSSLPILMQESTIYVSNRCLFGREWKEDTQEYVICQFERVRPRPWCQ